MRTKCYISGPITGIKDHMKHFEHYENRIKKEKSWAVINPARVCGELPPEDTTYAEYMDLSIALMRQCNCVFMLPGWENSKGARFENEYAKFCGMEIYEEDADRNIELRRM